MFLVVKVKVISSPDFIFLYVLSLRTLITPTVFFAYGLLASFAVGSTCHFKIVKLIPDVLHDVVVLVLGHAHQMLVLGSVFAQHLEGVLQVLLIGSNPVMKCSYLIALKLEVKVFASL